MGELQVVVWALKDVRAMVRGNRVCLHTDSNSVFHKLVNTLGKELIEDSRVMRMLGWLWSNFPMPDRLRLKFIPGDLNVRADVLSKWYENKQTEQNKTKWSRIGESCAK